MKRLSCTNVAARLSIAGALLLAGCATQPQPLYYWGDYQPQLYGHFMKEHPLPARKLLIGNKPQSVIPGPRS